VILRIQILYRLADNNLTDLSIALFLIDNGSHPPIEIELLSFKWIQACWYEVEQVDNDVVEGTFAIYYSHYSKRVTCPDYRSGHKFLVIFERDNRFWSLNIHDYEPITALEQRIVL